VSLQSFTHGDVAGQFRNAMRAAGLETNDEIIPDGKLHRVRIVGDKAGARNGWYVVFGDSRPAGRFGCNKRGIDETWRADIGRAVTAEEESADRKRMEATRRTRDAELVKVRTEASRKAVRLWAEANPRVSAKNPYLVAKGVRAYGIRQLKDALVIPVCDVDGKLHGLQFVQPDGTKRFTTGMAKAGHFHVLGDYGAVLLIAEGYATAATLREGTGHAVAVAFDAGNLASVARALRGKFPDARIVLAADNDHATADNPGLTKAREAADAIAGSVCAPEFLQGERGTDWNDYAALHGREAVRSAIAHGMQPSSPVTSKGSHAKPSTADQSLATGASPAARSGAPDPANAGRAHFTCDDGGVWWHDMDKDGRECAAYWVCPPLEVAAYLRDTSNENWGRLLEFKDMDRKLHAWGMPMRLLAGGCDEMRSELLRLGFDVPTNPKNRNLLTSYVQRVRPEASARCVERAGWHNDVFVMPERTIGENGERVLFQSETTSGHIYRERGDLGDWRSSVADLCRGNSRLVFCVSAALAGSLLHWAGDESGGFHLRGTSSSGKTTALRVAASVWGGPDFLRRWRATDNALEAIAAQHSDSLLILDELAQIEPRVAGEAAYMLANGEGKARGGRAGGVRSISTWRVLFLSAGELSLAEHMRQGNKQAQAGQETRMADIPADAGAGIGIFESLKGYDRGAALSRALVDAAADCYGVAGPAFISALQKRLDVLPDELRQLRRDFVERHVPKSVDGQVSRVAFRFALVAAAGELASRLGITGWEQGEAAAACARCFEAWIDARGGGGNLEPMRMLALVRRFLELHGTSRFPSLSDADKENWVTVNRAGYREYGVDGVASYYILPEAFEQEVCAGFDHRQVARVLLAVDALRVDGTEKRLKVRKRIPGIGSPWCYHVLPAIWEAVPP
jgi:putative DNA primase/helicase